MKIIGSDINEYWLKGRVEQAIIFELFTIIYMYQILQIFDKFVKDKNDLFDIRDDWL